MKTRIWLDLCHSGGGAFVSLSKEFDGYVWPRLRHEKLNFVIAVYHDKGTLTAEAQAVVWYPEDSVIVISCANITYDSVDEMEAEAEILRARGWE